NEYATPREAREAIARYIKVYNSVRPHQSLGNRTPAEVFYGSAEMLCA
ncbi:MAG: integrase core domain-containing protein, partial [Bacillota bacterium]